MQFPGTNMLASQLNPQSLDGRKQALINHLVTGQDQRRSNPLMGAGAGSLGGQGLGAFNPHAISSLQQGQPDQQSPFYGNPPSPAQAPPPPSNPQAPPVQTPAQLSTGIPSIAPTGLSAQLPTNPNGIVSLGGLLSQMMYGNGFRAN